MRERTKNKELDMTERPLFGKIFLFSLPIMLTGILQLLYNASDIIVLGRFASDVSAGAVGSTGSLINLTVNLFLGLSVGSCTAAARWIGAKNEERLDRVVHTAICLSLIGGVIMGVFGVCCSKYLLSMMNVPADSVLPLSTLYLQIYFAGMPFNLLYNFGSSLCRARGDSKNPLLFLCAAGVSNVGLNIFFVAVCKMDVVAPERSLQSASAFSAHTQRRAGRHSAHRTSRRGAGLYFFILERDHSVLDQLVRRCCDHGERGSREHRRVCLYDDECRLAGVPDLYGAELRRT